MTASEQGEALIQAQDKVEFEQWLTEEPPEFYE